MEGRNLPCYNGSVRRGLDLDHASVVEAHAPDVASLVLIAHLLNEVSFFWNRDVRGRSSQGRKDLLPGTAIFDLGEIFDGGRRG